MSSVHTSESDASFGNLKGRHINAFPCKGFVLLQFIDGYNRGYIQKSLTLEGTLAGRVTDIRELSDEWEFNNRPPTYSDIARVSA